MTTIGDYKIIKKISETGKCIIYRARKEGDDKTVILKVLKTAYPAPSEIARFKHEYKLIKNLDLEGVIKAYGIKELKDEIAIVLEDFNGITLKDFFEKRKAGIKDILKITIQLADTLGGLHKKNIIHKDIKPLNILINDEEKVKIDGAKVKITDFGIASVVTRENEAIYNPNVLEGTLPYISPEQSGRMNRAIDYRSDLYSLGVTFYEMLTGDLPFKSNDPMELIHSHIARIPAPVAEVNPEIPDAISGIVMKLLSKQAEDRYQSGYGLKADLEECLNQLTLKDKIENFFAGKNDISDRFQIPQKLYGREKEIELLIKAFDRVSNLTPLTPISSDLKGGRRGVEIMLVYGYSGIGKSALIHEIHKPIVKQKGYFLTGKYDQFRKDVPYSAIIQALQGLIRQLLMESRERLNAWREKLLDALGPNGQIIIDVMPKLDLVIGKQPPVPELGPLESRNRFNMTFQNFLKVFTKKEHPVALFLDDLQWVDPASLDLIKTLIIDQEIKYFFLIGAYRDNEVSPSHPLILTLDDLKKRDITINNISLTPLSIEHVNQLISDSLNCELDKSKALSELVYRKTEGNPFFVNQFLKSLYEENMLEFHRDATKRASTGWQWDMEKIQKTQMTDNVIELLAAKITKLPGNTREVLKLAACLGNRFNLETLAAVYEKSVDETLSRLSFAIQESYVFLSDNHYRFAHDRIHEAAYSLLPDKEKRQTHYKTGNLVLRKTREEELPEKIFYIVNQLNSGIELISNQKERLELTELNLMAGKKAKTSAAYASAVKYLSVGLKLLPENRWQNQYDLTYSLHLELSECEYLSGNFEEAEKLFDVVLNKAKTKDEKSKILCFMVQFFTSSGNLKKAIESGLNGLRQLGVSVSENSDEVKAEIAKKFQSIEANLKNKKIETIAKLPVFTDRAKIQVMEICQNMHPPAFMSGNLDLYTLMTVLMVDISLVHGNSPISSYAYIMYGVMLATGFNDYNNAYKFGKMGLELSEKFRYLPVEAKNYFSFANFINHWKKHAQTDLDYFLTAYKKGADSGDFPFAGYAILLYISTLLFTGKSLELVSKEVKKYYPFMEKTKSQILINSFMPYMQFDLNLRGIIKKNASLSNANYNEESGLENIRASKNLTGLCMFQICKLKLLYLFGNYRAAKAIVTELEQNKMALVGTAPIIELVFYCFLNTAALFPKYTQKEKESTLKNLTSHLEQMKSWEESCPENFENLRLLMSAEIVRLEGKDLLAMELYDKAIESASENGFTQNEAIANELAAKFYLSKGRDIIARAYLLEARYGYVRWGANAKVKYFDEEYIELLKKPDPKASISIKKIETDSIVTTTTAGKSEGLDLNTIMKASQAISSEIELANLLERLIKIVIENAGAEKGFLIMEKTAESAAFESTGIEPAKGEERGSSLFIEAGCIINRQETNILQSVPIEKSRELSQTIVEYAARTKENLVLNDATSEGEFTDDPYIIKNKPKSILCSPIIHQNKLSSILYLENNHTTGAFTPDRLEVLKLLSSQVAISIENAMLYKNLKEQERLKKEMEIAERIQTSLVPDPPQHEELEITALMKPAEEVGGDYYDIIFDKEKNLWLAIGDVSGHGVTPGLIMMMAQSSFSTNVYEQKDITPKEAIITVNRLLCENIRDRLKENHFMTMTFLKYTGAGNFIHAGLHLDIIVYRNKTKKCELIETEGIYLGIIPEISESTVNLSFSLDSEDIMLLYTDGITESRHKENRELMDTDRLQEMIIKHAGKGIEVLKKRILQETLEWCGYKPDDDITMMLVKRK